jgi:hypothetical protein
MASPSKGSIKAHSHWLQTMPIDRAQARIVAGTMQRTLQKHSRSGVNASALAAQRTAQSLKRQITLPAPAWMANRHNSSRYSGKFSRMQRGKWPRTAVATTTVPRKFQGTGNRLLGVFFDRCRFALVLLANRPRKLTEAGKHTRMPQKQHR